LPAWRNPRSEAFPGSLPGAGWRHPAKLGVELD